MKRKTSLRRRVVEFQVAVIVRCLSSSLYYFGAKYVMILCAVSKVVGGMVWGVASSLFGATIGAIIAIFYFSISPPCARPLVLC